MADGAKAGQCERGVCEERRSVQGRCGGAGEESQADAEGEQEELIVPIKRVEDVGLEKGRLSPA